MFSRIDTTLGYFGLESFAVAGLIFTNYWSFKVTGDCMIREKTHEFSLTFIGNYRSVFNRFRDNAIYWQKI